jgi:hypothetical protein
MPPSARVPLPMDPWAAVGSLNELLPQFARDRLCFVGIPRVAVGLRAEHLPPDFLAHIAFIAQHPDQRSSRTILPNASAW